MHNNAQSNSLDGRNMITHTHEVLRKERGARVLLDGYLGGDA